MVSITDVLEVNPRGGGVVRTSIVITVLAFLSVILRLFTRFQILKNYGAEDAFIFSAALGSIAQTIFTIAQTRFGLGRHMSTLTVQDIELDLFSLWAAIIAYHAALSLTKLSLLLQYRRIFQFKAVHTTCDILLVLVAFHGIVGVVVSAFSCYPVAAYWNTELRASSRCIDLALFWFVTAGFNIASDIAIVVIPIPVLKSLKLGKKQRWALYAIFALGVFTVITSLLRLHFLRSITLSKDITFDNVGIATISLVEVNVGILCTCLPLLRPLVLRLFVRPLASDRYQQSGEYQLSRSSRRHRASINLPMMDYQEGNGSENIITRPPKIDPGGGTTGGIEVTVQYRVDRSSDVADPKQLPTAKLRSSSVVSHESYYGRPNTSWLAHDAV